MWRMALEYKNKIKASWGVRIKGTKMFKLVEKLNRLNKVLMKLNKETFGDVEKREEIAREDLGQCQVDVQINLQNCMFIEKEIELAKEW